MGNSINTNWTSARPSTPQPGDAIKPELMSKRQFFTAAPTEKFYKPTNQPSAAANLPRHTASPNISTNILQPSLIQKNENIPKPDRQPFNSIKFESEKIFRELRKVQFSITNAISSKRKYTGSKTDLDALRLWRDAPSNAEKNRKNAGVEAYSQVQRNLNRKNSAMEKLLPAESSLRRDLYPFSGGLRDPKIGLYAELRELPADGTRKKKYVLCFTGTGRMAAIRAQMGTNLTQFVGVGGVPPAHKKALILTRELKTEIEKNGGELFLTGHSLGGGICNYVGTKLGINSTCYNSAALGSGCLNDLKKSKSLTAENLETQTHIRIKGDPVSSPRAQKIISFLINVATKIDLKIPTHIGKIYEATAADFNDAAPGKLDCHQLMAFEKLY